MTMEKRTEAEESSLKTVKERPRRERYGLKGIQRIRKHQFLASMENMNRTYQTLMLGLKYLQRAEQHAKQHVRCIEHDLQQVDERIQLNEEFLRQMTQSIDHNMNAVQNLSRTEKAEKAPNRLVPLARRSVELLVTPCWKKVPLEGKTTQFRQYWRRSNSIWEHWFFVLDGSEESLQRLMRVIEGQESKSQPYLGKLSAEDQLSATKTEEQKFSSLVVNTNLDVMEDSSEGQIEVFCENDEDGHLKTLQLLNIIHNE